MLTITLKIELLKPTKEKQNMYAKMTAANTRFANWLLEREDLTKATSSIFKYFDSEKFPSAVVNQTIREVKSQKTNQNAKKYKRLWCCFNNQNFKLEIESGDWKASFPTLEKRIGVPLIIRKYHQKWLDQIAEGNAVIGAAKLHERNGRWFVSVSMTASERLSPTGAKTMGIDIGLRYLAVASIGTNSLFFRGDEAAYIRRRYAARRKRLGKAKKLHAIKKSKDKESRWMKEQNHFISRKIIDHAKRNGVSLIRMEDLTGIRKTAKSVKEAGHNLHAWAHHQLQTLIAYKAELSGITVEFVNPKYTSQTCKCGYADKKNRNGLAFCCTACGYTAHADVNASINISKAISGLSKKTGSAVKAKLPSKAHGAKAS